MSFKNKVQALRDAKAQELRTREAEQAAELAHEAKFMTLGEVGCAAMARHQLGSTLDAWRLVYEALRDLPDLELFCRWHGDRKWVPLPGGPVKLSYSAGEANGPCYMLPTSPGQIPSPDPLGSALGQCVETAWWPVSCLAIRREVAERVFELDRDTTEKSNIPTAVRVMDDTIVERVAPDPIPSRGTPVDVDALRLWLEYPTWTLREGLLLLAGIDPHRSKDFHSNEDCTDFEVSPPPGTLMGGPSWGRIGYPQRAEVGANGVTFLVNGPVFAPDDCLRLWTLKEHWHRTPAHDGITRATPAHFIGWAQSANLAPHWLDAVRCAGYLPSAPALSVLESVAPPAGVVPAPDIDSMPKRPRRAWWDEVLPHFAEKLRVGRYSTMKALIKAIEAEAGSPSSPFDIGIDGNRGKLVLRQSGTAFALKTMQNRWAEVRAAAGLK